MLDNDELRATRKLNGIDDGMYGDKDIKEYKINMTKEQSIELLKNSLSKFEIRGEQLYLLKIAIENILSELEQKDKRIQELERENASKQKAYDDCYCEYKYYKQFESIPVQKVIVRINYYDERIKHAKQMRDKEQEEFYIDLKRAFNKLLEENK